MKDWIKDKLLPAIILALFTTLVQTYIEVKLLRSDVDRMEVYVDQLWRQK